MLSVRRKTHLLLDTNQRYGKNYYIEKETFKFDLNNLQGSRI